MVFYVSLCEGLVGINGLANFNYTNAPVMIKIALIQNSIR